MSLKKIIFDPYPHNHINGHRPLPGLAWLGQLASQKNGKRHFRVFATDTCPTPAAKATVSRSPVWSGDVAA